MVRSGPAGSGTTPSTPSESPECLNEDPIVSKWKGLASINQRSPDILPLLSPLVTGTGYLSTTRLRDESAKITLDALDKVCFPLVVPKKRWDNDVHYVIHQIFRDGKVPADYECDTRGVMQELACNSGQVPPRYQVKPGTLSVDGGVIASGNFSDLRRGKLDGRTVAVKTLKPHQGSNPRDFQKVRFVSKHFFLGYTDKYGGEPELLQGMYHLDDRFSSKPPTAYCRRH